MAINSDLKKLYEDDKNDRWLWENKKLNNNQIKQNDEKRLKAAKKLLSQKKIDLDEIWNCHYLCLLFMHSGSNDPEDYRKAHEFAKKAVLLGSNVTKWLYAASLDRWLVSQGKLQKYGTQYDFKSGRIFPYDKSTTDAERKKYGVVPLAKLLKR